MFAVDQDPPALLNALVDPLRAFHHLLDAQWLGVGRGEMQQLDMLFCQGLNVIAMLGARIDDISDPGARQGGYILGANAPAKGKMRSDPAHIEPIGQGDVQRLRDVFCAGVFWGRDVQQGASSGGKVRE